MTKPRAIMVAVDYSDLLRLTLPYNRHHFSEVWVVTHWDDHKTLDYLKSTGDPSLYIFVTDAFYRRGASFNKWLALEEGLDKMGRQGWICVMDADILIPQAADLCTDYLRQGTLYGALRHMLEDLSQEYEHVVNPYLKLPYPPERYWSQLPIHRNVKEWAGYLQVFNADDPHLGPTPWYEVDWRHAGGADSFFQAKWDSAHKIRFPWNVLHLGRTGQNWWGRTTKYLDGKIPKDAEESQSMTQAMWSSRHAKPGPTKFDSEKLK